MSMALLSYLSVQEMWRSAVLRPPPFAFLWPVTGDHRQHGTARLSRCHGTCNEKRLTLTAGPRRNTEILMPVHTIALHRGGGAETSVALEPFATHSSYLYTDEQCREENFDVIHGERRIPPGCVGRTGGAAE